jgi:hypothetical protein
MPDKVAVGIQSFSQMREQKCFFIDKTNFIKDWWDNCDAVTLITRPRRFGKTLNMDMLDCFFSTKYSGRGDLFEGLDIWEHEEYRKLQGTYPVISLSFAKIKNNNFTQMQSHISDLFGSLYLRYSDKVKNSTVISEGMKTKFESICNKLNYGNDERAITQAINYLSEVLSIHYGKKVIILLDEYDAPLQEAWINGFWDEAVSFTRLFFNSTFKTNEFMYRSVMTGITRVSKESLFSDLNNLEVCSVSSERYKNYFGFTEDEVFAAMDEFGYTNKDEVKYWYNGFTIGSARDIYNPWSVINFLAKNELAPYWSNTSSNALVSKLVREGDRKLKMDFEKLLTGEAVFKTIDTEMVFNQLDNNQNAVWSLLATSGYLRINSINEGIHELQIVNNEVMQMFRKLINEWFESVHGDYSDFISGLLRCDTQEMNEYMNSILRSVVSTFDVSQNKDDFRAPEKFYHGLVLGLLIELRDRYAVESNRESGFGRYDVMLIPKDKAEDKAFIIEFKVVNPNRGEQGMEDALANALKQIENKNYAEHLIDIGIPSEKIVKYGFAFEGKKVLIGRA